MRKAVLFSFVFMCGVVSWGQSPVKTVQKQEQAWLGYFNQTRFSTHWGLWADVHLRRTDFLDRWNQHLVRVGLTYYLADNGWLRVRWIVPVAQRHDTT